VLADKLQQRLTEGIELTVYESCFASCGSYQQAILTSLRETMDGSAWLTVLPTEPAYRLRDEQFRLAVRHRLGQLPYEDLREMVCLACRARNLNAPTFLADPDHLHAYVHGTGASVSLRHHRVVATLATLARSVGFVVRLEPHFAPQLHTTVDAETGEERTQTVPNEQRGDLLLVRHNTRLLVDVTVRRPTGATELRRHSAAVPLATAAAAEKLKHAKYDDACKREGLAMVPFALESYGAKGKQAQKLLLKLADASEELSAAAFLRHASASLSVALQCGNADIAAKGAQALRVHQLSQQQQAGSAGRNRASRRQLQRRDARTRAEPMRVDAFHSQFHAAAAAPSTRSGSDFGLAVRFDVDCYQADTVAPGRVDHERVVIQITLN
jgi:hypothetical protein